MDNNAKELVAIAEKRFAKKASLDELRQTIAEQVYPERANFTVDRTEGQEYALALYESGPAQARRDLAGAIGAILRPRGKEWFKPVPIDDKRRTHRAMAWCDYVRDEMRRVLYGSSTRFQKVMTDADDDFCAFGNAVPYLTESPDRQSFLFELSHLKCNAWAVDRYGEVNWNARMMKMELRTVAKRWGEGKLSDSQRRTLEKSPFEEIDIIHVCLPSDDYGPYRPKKASRFPWASIYINKEAVSVLEEGGYYEFPYLHRRWRVPDDSVYGYSPAAMLGLVDARVLQSQARVILDAGELAVAPPLIAKRDAILGGINNFAGAVTYLDVDYDERFGDALRPIQMGGDVRLGLEMKVDTRNILQAAWYLNKLSLPSDKEMTAYETSERIAEYIRSAGPVFEPFEADNDRVLHGLYGRMLRIGYFGSVEEIPPEMIGGAIKFEFDTPVSQAYNRVKVVRAKEVVEALGMAAQFDQQVVDNVDFDVMFRETSENIGGDVSWLKDKEVVEAGRAERAKKMQEMEDLQKANATLDAADKAGSAGQKLGQAASSMPLLMAQMKAMMGAGQQQQGQQDQGLLPPGMNGSEEQQDNGPDIEGLAEDAAAFAGA